MKQASGFLTAMLAVNVAVPVMASWVLKLVPSGARFAAVLLAAAGLVALNIWIMRRFPEHRGWVLGMIALNLAALVALGSVAAATALPGLVLLFGMLF